MSNNIKLLVSQEVEQNKKRQHKKNTKNNHIRVKSSKSIRGKIEKTGVKEEPIGVTDENDANQCNQCNSKKSIPKQKKKKMKSMEKVNNTKHSRHLSALDVTRKLKKNPKNIINKKVYSLNLENLLININYNNENKFETDEYREMFSKYIRDDYSNSIIKSLLEQEQINNNFLENHKINERMRTRMADWMIEVLSTYNCDESTYFESINLMDRYFKECTIKKQFLLPNELHLIGVTSMFIASKYQDIYPLHLNTVIDKIAHNKLCLLNKKKK
jgi:hypothetical protein